MAEFTPTQRRIAMLWSLFVFQIKYDMTMCDTYLGQAAPGSLDGHLALVVDCGPDVDRLPGHVTSAVKTHATRDGTRGETRHAQLVLYLTMEGLLEIKKINLGSWFIN